MGKRQVHRKDMEISDHESLRSSSSDSTPGDSTAVTEEVMEVEKDSRLEEALEALFEKRGSTREKALSEITAAFNSKLQNEFVEKNFATLLHQCLNSVKRGSAKEVALASHVIGLLAVMVGCGENAAEIVKESVPAISQALRSSSNSSKTAALVECLSIFTFVGANDREETETAMRIMWQLIRPELRPNVVVAVKPSADLIAAVVSAWSFLLTTLDERNSDPKDLLESVSYLSSLLDMEDRCIRIAAGEALALISENGSLEKLDDFDGCSDGSEVEDIQGLTEKILNQFRDLSAEASGKGIAKKDLHNQRNFFRDILDYIEGGYCPETSVRIGVDSLRTSTWSQLIQLNFLKRFLGGGFVKHMQDNEFLHCVFDFSPRRRYYSGSDHRMSSKEKRLFRSPNSALNKTRTKYMNNLRMMVADDELVAILKTPKYL